MTKLNTTKWIECAVHTPQLLHRIFTRSPKTKGVWMEFIFCADSIQWVIAGCHCIRCSLWMAHSANNYTVLCFHQIRHWDVNSKWFFVPSFASSHFIFGFCIRLNVICVTNEIATRSFNIIEENRIQKWKRERERDIFVFVVLTKMRFWWSSCFSWEKWNDSNIKLV